MPDVAANRASAAGYPLPSDLESQEHLAHAGRRRCTTTAADLAQTTLGVHSVVWCFACRALADCGFACRLRGVTSRRTC